MIKYLFMKVCIGKTSSFFMICLSIIYVLYKRLYIYIISTKLVKSHQKDHKYISSISNKQYSKILHCFAFRRMLREKIERK